MELANSIVTLQPGIYILRHPKTGMPPISISRAAANPEHNGRIEALYTPGTHGGVLRDGKDCIVMQVMDAPVDLLVTAYLETTGVAVPGLKIDKIALEAEGGSTAGKPFQIEPKGVSLIGHIERMGDVAAGPGQRLGDPATNLRLEGFQVLWPDKPHGVELAYSAQPEGSSEIIHATLGQFCGTRNLGRRLVSVAFSLAGPEAAKYTLAGSADFSGGFSAPLVLGQVSQGPTGLEHLTSLTLLISKRAQDEGPWAASPRTSVFGRGKSSKKSK